ncbi:MAG TPA: hypothetical protein VG817_04665, partial [Gemmatimonadales bacterium]|nr:hypothetical protein [Gemmatimonadales bacterium]
LEIQAGNHQAAVAGSVLAPLEVEVTRADGEPAEGVSVQWRVRSGCGQVSAAVSSSNALGLAATTPTLGQLVGTQRIEADVDGGDPVTFDFTATAPPSPSFQVLAGCDNVPERYGSDLWVADGYAYTGTWGFRSKPGNAVKVWKLDARGAPSLADSILISGVGTVSDLEVSPDGQWLIATTEGGGEKNGLYVYELTSPGHAVFRARQSVPNGLHTGTLAVIGGVLYAFTAKDPASCALNIYDLSTAATGSIALASATPIPDHYCIHDTFVRDGLAFVFAWNEGLYIYDVGNGLKGGAPAQPKLVSQSGQQGTAGSYGGETHNGWWFWNPTNGEKRYLFIGEEGPGTLGVSSSGSIHVVDVSNLEAPVQVAIYTLPGAGAHNFWMDEQAQILYAAFYNGGIVALDVSGTLTGDLSSREIARVRPGGASNTYIWGVMLYNGYLYGSDMLSGFWQLAVP